jgi:hypothetical protein
MIGERLREPEVGGIPGIRKRDMRTGHVWYDLPRAEIAGQTVAVSLCFVKEKLHWLTVGVVDDQRYGASWGDWSPAKERARAEATGRWLADLGYAVGTYPWGSVYAETDPKTGDGGGGVRFR